MSVSHRSRCLRFVKFYNTTLSFLSTCRVLSSLCLLAFGDITFFLLTSTMSCRDREAFLLPAVGHI